MIVGVNPLLLKTKQRDPFFADVVSLLHFNGADASTTFTDETGKTWTANGNAQIDTAQSQFGGASGLFDGTGDYITTADSTDFTFGTNDFTIEAWLRLNALAGGSGAYIFGQMSTSFLVANGSVLLALGADSKPALLVASGSSFVVNLASPDALTTGVWYHLAATRSGNTFRIFVDGALKNTSTSSASANNSTHPASIGRPGAFNGAYINGWIDDFRLTNGTARYTAAFTPPDKQFPDS